MARPPHTWWPQAPASTYQHTRQTLWFSFTSQSREWWKHTQARPDPRLRRGTQDSGRVQGFALFFNSQCHGLLFACSTQCGSSHTSPPPPPPLAVTLGTFLLLLQFTHLKVCFWDRLGPGTLHLDNRIQRNYKELKITAPMFSWVKLWTIRYKKATDQLPFLRRGQQNQGPAHDPCT